LLDADYALTVTTAHATLPRIDVVVLEINSDVGTRANSLKVIKGTAASTPVPPTLTNTSTIHQYPLAHISIPAGLTTILASHITNKIGTVDCPFVTGPLEVLTTEAILAEWTSEFMTWFDDMKGQLSTDAAGALQLQIDAIEDGTVLPSWTYPTLVNGWGNSETINAPVRYYKAFGTVNLFGTIFGGSSETISFTLPVGYRPAHTCSFIAFTRVNYPFGQVEIGTNGTVLMRFIDSNVPVSFDGVSFRVA
jgi:hypothetical protein